MRVSRADAPDGTGLGAVELAGGSSETGPELVAQSLRTWCNGRNGELLRQWLRERRWGPSRDAVVGDWTGWLSPGPWGLQLHMNCRDPLGEGSWRYALRLIREEVARRCGVDVDQVVVFAVTQANAWRPRYHLHSLIALEPGLVEGRAVLLGLNRWRGPGALGPWIAQLLAQLHAVARPHAQEVNAAMVTLKPVNPRGAADDPYALVRYVVRYLLRQDQAGAWLEMGDMARLGLQRFETEVS